MQSNGLIEGRFARMGTRVASLGIVADHLQTERAAEPTARPDALFGYGQAFETTSVICGPFPRTPPKPFTWPGVRPDGAWFYDTAEDQIRAGLGVVGADTTSVVLRLDDGQQLKLIPVNRYGYRLVAFVIPQQAGIAAATA
jgi:hypothetical protein